MGRHVNCIGFVVHAFKSCLHDHVVALAFDSIFFAAPHFKGQSYVQRCCSAHSFPETSVIFDDGQL